MEKGTRQFYGHAAEQAKTVDARDMFRKLHDWEDSHMQYIESLYQALMGDRDFRSYEEFREKVPADHMESGIPVREAKRLFEIRRPADDIEIVTLALEMEGKAYNLYRRNAESARDTNARAVFREMMAQERHHIDELMKLRKSIEK